MSDKHTPTPLTENEAITRHDKGLFLISSNEHDGLIETIATLRAENDKLELVQTDLVFENQVYRGQIEELRAEKAELIEALKQIEVYKDGDTWLQDIIAIKKFASQTLAKLKTK